MRAKELRRILRCRLVSRLPGILGKMPSRMGYGVCSLVGLVALRVIPRDRRRAHRNLARVYPDASPREVAAMARTGMRELGKNVYDFLRYPGLSPNEQDALVEIEGLERLRSATQAGRGAVVVSGHLGCWELIGACLEKKGFPVRGLVRPLRETRLDRLLRAHRRAMGIETIDSTSPLAAVRHVRSGGVLVILVDQRVPRGLWVDFLGQQTLITDAAARIALATHSPIVPVAVARKNSRHHVLIGHPVDPPKHPGQIRAVTQGIIRPLERQILSHRSQWIWIHPRWEEDPAPSQRTYGNSPMESVA